MQDTTAIGFVDRQEDESVRGLMHRKGVEAETVDDGGDGCAESAAKHYRVSVHLELLTAEGS